MARALWVAVMAASIIAGCSSDDGALFPDELGDDPIDAGSDVSLDAPDGDLPRSCEAASDCPAPSHPCQLALCVSGSCATANAPAGTHVPDSAQVVGDCKRLQCGEGGGFATVDDPADAPPDDGNVCTRLSCDGPNPRAVHEPVGTPCGTDGICNGSGICGSCTPNAQDCDGKVPRVCNASGQWQASSPCPFACDDGVCTGTCSSGATQCAGPVLQTCNANGQWLSDKVCPYLCSGGACVGECLPGSKKCDGLVPQVCDSNAMWQNGAECAYVCEGGACTGVCTPGDKQCNGLIPRTCTAAGQWQSGTACQYTCQAGSCGECSPGSKRCQGSNVQQCDANGSWKTTATCSYVCSGSGTCGGSCIPGEKRCSGLTPQTCDSNGQWVSGTACTTRCSVGVCTELTCAPGVRQCVGNSLQTCDSAGTWQSPSPCPYVCRAGACAGVCAPGSKRCTGNTPEECNSFGQWQVSGADCAEACFLGACYTYPLSCSVSIGAGTTTCGPGKNESCCASLLVPGGTFYRGFDGVGSSDTSFPATVSDFRLEKYEVTVARFRAFVLAVTNGWLPPVGSGKHEHLNGGAGMNGGTELGWQAAWNTYLPNQKSTWDSANFLACGAQATWTPSPTGGDGEWRPINCVSWYQAQAFCIWDGGFLPSEAEWHYAASGGSEQRVFPWAAPATSTTVDSTYASYACMGDGSSACGVTDLLFVGSKPKGQGRWGHLDLAGNVSEWTVDRFVSPYASGSCSNCANLAQGETRVIRGGSWKDVDTCSLRSTERRAWGELARNDTIGFRCARPPQ